VNEELTVRVRNIHHEKGSGKGVGDD